jgi:hypothetical protein
MNVLEGGCLFYGPKMQLRDQGPARLRQLLWRCMHMLYLSKKLPSQFLSIVPFASCVLYVARNQSFVRLLRFLTMDTRCAGIRGALEARMSNSKRFYFVSVLALDLRDRRTSMH